MAFNVFDRIRETSTTTGTGDLTLNGTLQGFRTFGSVLASGDTTWYVAAFGGEWEVGVGTFTAPATLSRTTVLSSSNGTSLVDFSAGSKDVFISPPASVLKKLADLGTFGTAAQRNAGAAAGNVPVLDAAAKLLVAIIPALADLGALARAGDTMTGLLTLSGDPTTALHAATKQYVDNLVQGLDAKASVLATTTTNITLSGTQTVDGVALVAGNRVLVKDQTTASQNGLYVVASGAWARAPDADVWGELPSAFVLVESGTVNADTGWVCTSDVGGTLGTTAVTWVKFGTLAGLAALASPAFTGTPTAPTAAQGTNTTQIATLAFVIAEIAARLPAYATTTDIWTGTDTGKIVTAKALRDAQVPQTLAASATPAWNAALGFNAKITLTANTTFQTPTNLVEGLTYVLRAKQDATGGRTGSYTSAYNFGADGAPTLSTAANAEDALTFLCVDAATPRLSFVGIKKGI